MTKCLTLSRGNLGCLPSLFLHLAIHMGLSGNRNFWIKVIEKNIVRRNANSKGLVKEKHHTEITQTYRAITARIPHAPEFENYYLLLPIHNSIWLLLLL